MKKFTCFVLLLAAAFVNAQNDDTTTSDKLSFTKGSQFVNLNLSLISSTVDSKGSTQTQETTSLGFTINPSYSYAVGDNLFLGLGVGYTYNDREGKINGVVENEANTNSYSIFPFVRYYKGIGKKLALFVQGETRYSYSKTEVNEARPRTTDSFFIGVRPGLVFMLNKNFGLETSIGALGYTTSSIDDEAVGTESDFNRFDFSLSSSNLFFGLNYYF
jgi:hypothetical protein